MGIFLSPFKKIKRTDMDFNSRYDNVKNLLPTLSSMSDQELRDYYEEAKETMLEYENMQLICKLNMNSLYGVSAAQGYSLVDYDIAEDITGSARHFAILIDVEINKFFSTWANPENYEKNLKITQQFCPDVVEICNFQNYVRDSENDLCIYGDTDSRYIDVHAIMTKLMKVHDENGEIVFKKFPDNTPEGNKYLAQFGVDLDKYFISKIISDSIAADIKKRGANDGHLKMALETISRKCVYQKKKKYIMSLVYKDGKIFETPKLKVQGVEIKRGEFPPKMKALIEILVKKFVLEEYSIKAIREEIVKLFKYIKLKKDIELAYKVSSVKMKDTVYQDEQGHYKTDKTHIQAKIAVSWCNFIERNNLTDRFQVPFNGQKMNFFYTETDDVFGFPDDVDYNEIPNIPAPNWNKMIKMTLVKSMMRYILEDNDFDEKDIDNFLLGITKLSL